MRSVALALTIATLAVPAWLGAQDSAPPMPRATTILAPGATGRDRWRLRPDSEVDEGAERGRTGGGQRPDAIALTIAQPARADAPWWAPLASAVVPGAGQVSLGQDRALAYFAVEAYGWLRYASDIREARRQRAGYRDLAARVARANLSEARPPGDFEYYERMEHYVESGVFDASAEEGVQPETNPESYNGFIWLRARTTFWEDPTSPPPVGSDAFVAAMDYYAGRAIKPEFRWSWRNAQLEQDLFRQTISRSNEAFRRSIQDLGVLIANHALSTVDAYVSVRVRNVGVTGDGLALEASIPIGGARLTR